MVASMSETEPTAAAARAPAGPGTSAGRPGARGTPAAGPRLRAQVGRGGGPGRRGPGRPGRLRDPRRDRRRRPGRPDGPVRAGRRVPGWSRGPRRPGWLPPGSGSGSGPDGPGPDGSRRSGPAAAAAAAPRSRPGRTPDFSPAPANRSVFAHRQRGRTEVRSPDIGAGTWAAHGTTASRRTSPVAARTCSAPPTCCAVIRTAPRTSCRPRSRSSTSPGPAPPGPTRWTPTSAG